MNTHVHTITDRQTEPTERQSRRFIIIIKCRQRVNCIIQMSSGWLRRLGCISLSVVQGKQAEKGTDSQQGEEGARPNIPAWEWDALEGQHTHYYYYYE